MNASPCLPLTCWLKHFSRRHPVWKANHGLVITSSLCGSRLLRFQWVRRIFCPLGCRIKTQQLLLPMQAPLAAVTERTAFGRRAGTGQEEETVIARDMKSCSSQHGGNISPQLAQMTKSKTLSFPKGIKSDPDAKEISKSFRHLSPPVLRHPSVLSFL